MVRCQLIIADEFDEQMEFGVIGRQGDHQQHRCSGLFRTSDFIQGGLFLTDGEFLGNFQRGVDHGFKFLRVGLAGQLLEPHHGVGLRVVGSHADGHFTAPLFRVDVERRESELGALANAPALGKLVVEFWAIGRWIRGVQGG